MHSTLPRCRPGAPRHEPLCASEGRYDGSLVSLEYTVAMRDASRFMIGSSSKLELYIAAMPHGKARVDLLTE